MSQNDEPAQEQSSGQKREIQLFALEPRFLRKSILLVLIGVLIFQLVTWSLSLLRWIPVQSFTGLAARNLNRPNRDRSG